VAGREQERERERERERGEGDEYILFQRDVMLFSILLLLHDLFRNITISTSDT